MSFLLLGNKSKKELQQAPVLPQPPNIEGVIEDLEAAEADDIVFTFQPEFKDSDFNLKERFKRDLNSEDPDSLCEKVIQHSQNLEKLKNLQSALPEVKERLSQASEEVEEDIKKISGLYVKSVDLYQEVSAKQPI